MSLLEGKQMRVTTRDAITFVCGTSSISATKPQTRAVAPCSGPARRAFYREILGGRVRVNLIPPAIAERGQEGESQSTHE